MIKRLCLILLLGTRAVALSAAPPFEGSPFGPVVAAAWAGTDQADPAKGNRLALISGGYDALLLRVHLIRQARVAIDVQTFIWTNDECGRLLMYELIEAARRGVKVRIITDHLFSAQDPETTAFLATVHPDLEIRHYRPPLARMKPSLLHKALATLQSFHGINQRMHNKLMVFDGTILLTGGRNVENTYFDHSTELNYRDRDVLAVGPVVRSAAESFAEFWGYRHSVPSRDLADVATVIARDKFRRYATRADYDFGGHFTGLTREADDRAVIQTRFVDRLKPAAKVAFICDEPGKSAGFFSRTARITRELRRTLEQASNRVVMQTPYLVLSHPAQRLIRGMQEKNPGLRIQISSNSFASTDNLIAYSANYRLRNKYVENLHLEVHEFKPRPEAMPVLFPQYPRMAELAAARIAAGRQSRPPFLCMHAKSLVVDDGLAFVGSYNLDPRSENLNTEAGLLVEDAAFARELREEIERDMRPENSWVIARRNIPLRLDVVNGLIDGILSLTPVDVWPIENTSSFELRPGATEVPPGDPAFYQHYRDVGSFPGTDGLLSNKEILTRIYKTVGPALTPVL
ncbi:MAG: phospholipase D family protein [Opitutae bacterium]|nr:phospholipase D family protein [Opitutae bacterium]